MRARVLAALAVPCFACAQGAAPQATDDLAVSRAVDPGPRGGSPGAGGSLPGLTADEKGQFAEARDVFAEIDSVSGSVDGEEGAGLGPTFNSNSCGSCHSEPALGGSSPHPALGFVKTVNPQLAMATLDRIAGREQLVPSFILSDGPVREARFVKNKDGTVDGGVHALWTIAGRIDARDCNLAQPDFAGELLKKNVIFRIPTPMFGAGLVENVADATLLASFAATAADRKRFGIAGRFNRSGNDGTITRFGWKAQNKSLAVFAGEAYNVEQGVTNELFPNERAISPGCNVNPTPEDHTRLYAAGGGLTGSGVAMSGDAVSFALFARLLAPPAAATTTPSQLNGQRLFASAGCALCHTPSLVTDDSPYTGQGRQAIHPFSDFAIHHMGATLADGVSQGAAGPDEFRSAPLWGAGQRIFFLHDGRAGPKNGGLVAAILAHRSACSDAAAPANDPGRGCGSEANGSVAKFTGLTTAEQQDILNFLRSL